MNISDKVVSLLRTGVPILWGYIVTWLLAQVPALGDFLNQFGVDLNSAVVVNWVTGVAALGWYAVWRWAEPRLPAWLTRIVLGSNQAPSYDNGKVIEGDAYEVPPIEYAAIDGESDEDLAATASEEG